MVLASAMFVFWVPTSVFPMFMLTAGKKSRAKSADNEPNHSFHLFLSSLLKRTTAMAEHNLGSARICVRAALRTGH
jgi:hypothetical protein